MFQAGLELAEKNDWDVYILSAKYGAIPKERFISDYDKTVKTTQDIETLKRKSVLIFRELFKKYGKVVLRLSKNYLSSIELALNENCYLIFDERGIRGYKQKLSQYFEFSEEDLITELQQFKYSQDNHNKPLNLVDNILSWINGGIKQN